MLASVVPLMVIAWVAFVDLEAAVIMALTLPLVPVFMWLIGRYTEQRTKERWQALRQLSTHFLDVVRGLPTLRAFGRAETQVTLDRRGQRALSQGNDGDPAGQLPVRLGARAGGDARGRARRGDRRDPARRRQPRAAGRPDRDRAGAGALPPFRRLGAEYHASADGLAVAERMFALLDAPAAAVGGGPRLAPSPARATVALEHVSFSYPGRAVPVLDGLELQLAPGEAVALVGESGAGKSTVAGLLLGLLAPTAGTVTVGGVDLAACQIDAWRRLIAWVPQHPALLRATVADNIRLADPSATAEMVREAAARAGADQFIRALPDGYAT